VVALRYEIGSGGPQPLMVGSHHMSTAVRDVTSGEHVVM
jgi:hypothetical protein